MPKNLAWTQQQVSCGVRSSWEGREILAISPLSYSVVGEMDGERKKGEGKREGEGEDKYKDRKKVRNGEREEKDTVR